MSTGQASTGNLNRFLPWLCLAICLFAFIVRILPGPRTIDDAYITFRYARNLLSGSGFVFNTHEQVLGTTTPLYTLILVMAGAAFNNWNVSFPLLAMIINALADGLVCYFLFQLGQKFGSPRVAVGVSLVWAIAPYSVTFAIGGLETSIYILTILAAVYFHVFRQHLLAAGFCALAFLTRPDALILIIPLILDRLWQVFSPELKQSLSARRFVEISLIVVRTYKTELLVFILPITAWLCFSTIYFGSPVPQSIAAKSLAYQVDSTSAFIRLLQHYMTPFLEHLTFGTRWIAVGIVLYPFLYLAGALHALRLEKSIWPFVIYPWLYFAIYTIANPLIFRWYLTPPLPALFLFILIGIDVLLTGVINYLLGWIAKKTGVLKLESFKSVLASIFCVAFVVIIPVSLSLRDWTLHPDHGLNQPAPRMSWYQLELLYREAAGFLQPYLDSSTGTPPVIAAADVGVLGYYTGAAILDTVGLNSPISSKYYPLDQKYYSINYAIPPQLIIDRQPDYLVFLEVYGREGLLKDARISDLYTLVRKFPTDIYGSQGLLVMKRK